MGNAFLHPGKLPPAQLCFSLKLLSSLLFINWELFPFLEASYGVSSRLDSSCMPSNLEGSHRAFSNFMMRS